MTFHAAPFRMTLVALAAATLLAACGGGGDATPPPDNIPPSLAISDNVIATTATGPVIFTFTFSEAVTDFDASDIVVSGGTAGAFALGATNRSATLSVTPGDNTTGTISVSVAAGRFTDFSRNANTSAATATQAFDTRAATPPPPPPPSSNLVANGSFSNGATGWIGNAVDVRTEGGNSFNFANVTAVGNPFDVNLSYPLSIPTQGVRYRLTFTASSDRARTLIAGIGLNQDPWTNAVETVNLTTAPQTFVRELTANFANANSRVFFDMGAALGTVVIDDVVLEVITASPPPPPPPAANLVANGAFSSGATGWSGNALNVVTEGGNSFNLANVATAGNAFDVNLSYALPIPTQGVRYRLTFTASSNRNRTLVAGIGLAGAPFTAAVETVNLTTTPQTIVRELTANFASNDSRVIFDMGADTGTVVIDDVVLEVITASPPPPPPPPGGALTFSSGFASNVLTAEGGRIDSAGGSNLDGFNCNGQPAFCGSGAGGSGAESFMFFYYQTPSPATALYSQVEVFAPGVTGFSASGDTAGVTVTNQTRVNFTFNPNPEWYNSTNNRFGVILTLGRRYAIDGGCRLQLHGVMTPTAPGSTAYSMNLRNDFRVAADCGAGIPPTDVAAALAASPVISSVKFIGAAGGAAIIGRDNVTSGANLSIANGEGVYPTTVALRGGITFD